MPASGILGVVPRGSLQQASFGPVRNLGGAGGLHLRRGSGFQGQAGECETFRQVCHLLLFAGTSRGPNPVIWLPGEGQPEPKSGVGGTGAADQSGNPCPSSHPGVDPKPVWT